MSSCTCTFVDQKRNLVSSVGESHSPSEHGVNWIAMMNLRIRWVRRRTNQNFRNSVRVCFAYFRFKFKWKPPCWGARIFFFRHRPANSRAFCQHLELSIHKKTKPKLNWPVLVWWCFIWVRTERPHKEKVTELSVSACRPVAAGSDSLIR